MTGATPAGADFFELAGQLLVCVGEQLELTPGGRPEFEAVVPGAIIAWDHCACGGQLTVNLLRTYQSENFPTPKARGPWGRDCQLSTVAEYTVTVLRCVPTLDDHGRPPKAAAMQAAAQIDYRDRLAVMRGVVCCLQQRRHLVAEQLAVGEGGQCAGSELHVFVDLGNCWPCGEPEPTP